MSIVSVIGSERGCGKTFVCLELLRKYLEHNQKVLLINLDDSYTNKLLQKWENKGGDRHQVTMERYLKSLAKLDITIGPTTYEFKNLVYAIDMTLKDEERTFDMIAAGSNLNEIVSMVTRMNLQENTSINDNAHIIANLISHELVKSRHYDVVLINCPIEKNVLWKSAVIMSQIYVVPILANTDTNVNSVINSLNDEIYEIGKSSHQSIWGDRKAYYFFNKIKPYRGRAIRKHSNIIESSAICVDNNKVDYKAMILLTHILEYKNIITDEGIINYNQSNNANELEIKDSIDIFFNELALNTIELL